MITSPQDIENIQVELAEARSTIRRFEEHVASQHKDKTSLERLVQEKNSRILSLEAENIRLKMLRTDAELRTQVDGLRTEVGKKDRELVELRRVIEKFKDNEKSLLGRTAAAEQRALTFQENMKLMQADRDSADEKLEEQSRLRNEAVRKMVDAVSAREGLDRRILDLLGIISSMTKVLPLLPPALVKSSKDVQALLAAMKKVDVKA